MELCVFKTVQHKIFANILTISWLMRMHEEIVMPILTEARNAMVFAPLCAAVVVQFIIVCFLFQTVYKTSSNSILTCCTVLFGQYRRSSIRN